ncbi:MAG: hypothetical protein JSV92_04640 [archaeon]|nr:MAG: hypothetical protein JSV92_04640 [archaeon]
MLYLVPVLIISAVICYDDLKNGFIRNKYLLAILLIFLIKFSFGYQSFLNSSFLYHMLFASFIGIFLYSIDLWSAADGKFFMVLSLFIPFRIPDFYTPLDFLINSAVPLFFAYMILVFVKSKWKEIKGAFKFAFDPYKIFLITTVYLGAAWFLVLPLSYLGIPVNIFTFIIILFIIIEFINKFLSFNIEILFVVLAILRIILDFRNVYTAGFLAQLAMIVLLFLFFRYFVLRLGFKINTRKIKIKDLKPGMDLAEGIRKGRGKKITYEKIPLFQATFYDFLLQKKEKFIHSKELTEEDIKKIRKIRKDLPFDSILVHQPMPFAVFLFVGFLLTLLFETNFIHAISNL